jgi:hypothetical protein
MACKGEAKIVEIIGHASVAVGSETHSSFKGGDGLTEVNRVCRVLKECYTGDPEIAQTQRLARMAIGSEFHSSFVSRNGLVDVNEMSEPLEAAREGVA